MKSTSQPSPLQPQSSSSITSPSSSAHVYPAGSTFHSMDDIPGKRVTVMGLGLNGGGEAAVRFFLRHGATVIATDMKDAAHLKPTIDSIAANPPIDSSLLSSRLTYHLGGHSTEDFVNTDCVIKNPGVKFEGNKFLAAAVEAGVPIESDISVFLSLTAAPIVAVTGSKGKSSTVSALHWILTRTGFEAYMGGNIAMSPLNFVENTTGDTPVVLELSSWQLADLRGRGLLRPRISIITKIVPDHQNWYPDMASYVEDKKLVYADQGQGDYAIFDMGGDGDTWGGEFAAEAAAHGVTVLRYAAERLPRGVRGAWQESVNGGDVAGMVRLADGRAHTVMRTLLVPGQHVRTNALNAALAAVILGAVPRAVCRALAAWHGIEHRLQLCHQWVSSSAGGTMRVQFYDDSCSTVAEASAAAANAFDSPVILIAGGTDKGLPQDALADCIKDGQRKGTIIKTYLLKGTATEKLIGLLEGASYSGPYDSLDVLVLALKGDIQSMDPCSVPVVFSPGSTSFGMFANEFDRGDKFQAAVRSMF